MQKVATLKDGKIFIQTSFENPVSLYTKNLITSLIFPPYIQSFTKLGVKENIKGYRIQRAYLKNLTSILEWQSKSKVPDGAEMRGNTHVEPADCF